KRTAIRFVKSSIVDMLTDTQQKATRLPGRVLHRLQVLDDRPSIRWRQRGTNHSIAAGTASELLAFVAVPLTPHIIQVTAADLFYFVSDANRVKLLATEPELIGPLTFRRKQ